MAAAAARPGRARDPSQPREGHSAAVRVRAAKGPSKGAGLPGAFASNADLQRRVERAFDLAETTIEQIVARESGLDLSALEAPPDKVVAETAMLLRAVAALTDGTVRRCRVTALASQLAVYAQGP